MGTHPIFESDFDCLTEVCVLLLFAVWPYLPNFEVGSNGELLRIKELKELPCLNGNKMKLTLTRNGLLPSSGYPDGSDVSTNLGGNGSQPLELCSTSLNTCTKSTTRSSARIQQITRMTNKNIIFARKILSVTFDF